MGILERMMGALTRAIHGEQTWPPKELAKRRLRLEGYRRRFENDREALIQHDEYWHNEERKKTFTPVPFAREVARYSASLLFAEAPKVTLPKAETEEGEKQSEDPRAEVLERVLEANALEPFLQETAERIASEGRGALRIIRDETVSDEPLVTFVPDDRVLWEVRHGRFVVGGGVLFEYEKGVAGETVYRLIEEHEPGWITRKLYRGTSGSLGQEVNLYSRADAPEAGSYVGTDAGGRVTRESRLYAIPDLEGLEGEEATGLDKPTLVRWDNVPGGHSDIKGLESLQDRINEAVSGGVAKERSSRPLTFADPALANGAGKVDLSGIIFSRGGQLQNVLGDEPKNYAEVVQPEFQEEEQAAWFWFLWDVAAMHAGYSVSAWARDAGGQADSGRALRMKLVRTLLTRSGKERMAREAIRTALAVALAWSDGNGQPREIADFRPEVELGDGLPRDAREDAEEAVQWRAAEGISTEEVVRMRRPDLDDDGVAEEVERIEAEKPQPPTGFAGQSQLFEPGSLDEPDQDTDQARSL